MLCLVDISPTWHAGVLLGCLAVIGAEVWIGRRCRSERGERRFRRLLGVYALVVWLASMIYCFGILSFNPRWHLPLHVCDIALFMAILALLTGKRFFRAVLYFWCYAFCIQSFITPVIGGGPGTYPFWHYWVYHGTILSSSVYDIAVARFRPRLSDLFRAVAAILVYGAVVLPLDIIYGWNYGFLGNHEMPGTLLVVFGPWPLRLAWMALFGLSLFTVLWLPWCCRPFSR